MTVPMPHRALLPTLAAVAFLAACGGDDGTSKSDFLEEADAICAEGEERAEQIVSEGFRDPENPTGKEVVALIQDLVPVQRETISDVRELDMPEGEEDEINSILDQAEAATAKAADIRDPQEALAIVQAADTPQDPFYEANQAAAEYGFDECAE
jgi:hypothetical protein